MRRQAQGPSVQPTRRVAAPSCGRSSASRGPRLAALLIAVAALCAGFAPPASAADKQVVSAIGSTGSTGGLLSRPQSMAVNSSGAGGVPAGTLYVLDGENYRVQQFTSTGTFVRAWGQDVVASGPGNVDSSSFEICVAADGDVCQRGTFRGSVGGAIDASDGLAVDQATGAVYATNSLNARVQKFSATGSFAWAAGMDVVQPGGTGEATGPARDERQRLTLGDEYEYGLPPIGGTFTLTFNAQTTAPLPYDASPGAVDAALEALSSVGAGALQVAGPSGGPWDVDFQGPLAGTNVPAITGDGSGLTVEYELPGAVFVRTLVPGGPGPAFEMCTVSAQCKAGEAGIGAGQLSGGLGVPAVDPLSGGVLVPDFGNRRVAKLSGAGAWVSAFGWGVQDGGAGVQTCTSTCQAGVAGSAAGQFGAGAPSSVAVDASGQVYAVDGGNGRVLRFDAAATSGVVFAAGALSDGPAPTAVTVDPVDGDVYVIKPEVPEGSGASKLRVVQMSAAGSVLGQHGAGGGIPFFGGIGLAFDRATGNVYLSTDISGESRVLVLNTPVPPIGVIKTPTAVTAHSMTLTGTVDPQGFATRYRFEYSGDGGRSWAKAPSTDVNVGGGTGEVSVTAPVSGLESNTTYQVRLAMTKTFNPTAYSPLDTATTALGPIEQLDTGEAFPVRSTTATLHGVYVAGNLPATFRFEYGRDTGYGASVGGETSAAGGLRKPSVRLTGLEPMTVYHYRLVATTSQGTVAGPDRTFRTSPAAVSAPDGRAYEMVSPPDKSTRRMDFSPGPLGLIPLPGMPSPDGESLLVELPWGVFASPGGSKASDPVRLVRTADGWRTQSIFNSPLYNRVDAAFASLSNGASRDQSMSVWNSNPKGTVFPEESGRTGGPEFPNSFDLRFMDRDPSWATPEGWTHVPGWTPLLTSPAQDAGEGRNISASLFTDSGRWLVRSSYVRGSLGPSDPSWGQRTGFRGGGTVYRRSLQDGSWELVNACTGSGADATHIPNRANAAGTADGTGAATDTIGMLPCAEGTLTSTRGAVVGGGGGGNLGSDSPNMGTARNAVSNTAGHDGDRVFFVSPDPLVPAVAGAPQVCAATVGAATDCPSQLYVRRWDADGRARVAWISRSRSHPAGGGAYDGAMIPGQAIGLLGHGVAYEGASADGSSVFFSTDAPLTPDDPNGAGVAPPPGGVTTGTASNMSWDLYRYDLPADPNADPDTGTLTRLTGGADGTADPNTRCVAVSAGTCAGTGYGSSVRLTSADGRKAYLVTAGIIAGADNAAPAGSGPANVAGTSPADATTRNLYLYDAAKAGTDRWAFVARLPYGVVGDVNTCAATGQLISIGSFINSNADSGVIGESENCLRGNADGSTIAFMTARALTADDTDAAVDVYAYDSDQDALTRIARPQGGDGGPAYACVTRPVEVRCNADLGWKMSLGGELNAGPAGIQFLNVASDGSVLFESRVPLVPEDVNGSRMDTYQWKDGELSLISPGNSDHDAYFSGNSASGRDVFFWTTQPIDPREIDPGDGDIYDARVGGGFPLPSSSPPCQALADQCKGGGASSPPAKVETGHPGAKAPTGRVGVRRLSAAQLAALAAGRRVFLVVEASRPGRVQVRGSARLAKKRRASVLNASKRITRPGTARVALRLSGSGRDGLARRGRLRVLVSVELLGAPERASLTFSLKAPARQRAAGADRRASS